MKHKASFLIFFTLLGIVFCFGQDSSRTKMHKSLQVGLYQTKEEFFSKKPSIITPFIMVPLYKKRENKDSFVYAYSCRLEDSSININKVYGLFDGNKLFSRGGNNVFYDWEGLGRHPFSSFVPDPFTPGVLDIIFPSVELLDGLVSRPKEVIYFYNKKRKLVEASIVAMILLLKDDKDLENEFRKEKVKNTHAFKKYLLKMNERYLY